MAGGVDISIKMNAEPMREKLADMRARLLDLEPVMEGRAEAYETMSKSKIFNKEQSPLGDSWEPLSARTIARRKKKSTKILTNTGELQNAISATATKTGIRVGVSGAPATYAAVHQYGHTFNRMSSRGKPYQQKVPRRPFLPLNTAGIVVSGSGPMKTFMTRMAKRVKAYILKGEL